MSDWAKLLEPGTPPLDILIRGTVMYLALFAMLRIVLKRESGTTGITDLLVIVLIADAAQNGMADDYTSVTDGLLLVAVQYHHPCRLGPGNVREAETVVLSGAVPGLHRNDSDHGGIPHSRRRHRSRTMTARRACGRMSAGATASWKEQR